MSAFVVELKKKEKSETHALEVHKRNSGHGVVRCTKPHSDAAVVTRP